MWTLDGALRDDGWSFGGAIVGRYDTAGDAGRSAYDTGLLFQGSFLIGDTEPFARYDLVIPDNDRARSTWFNTLTLGVNHYIHGRAARFTADIHIALNSVSGTDIVRESAGLGLYDTDSGAQASLRLQFQLMF